MHESFETNVWRVQFLDDDRLAYRLDRATKSPFFELRFDLPRSSEGKEGG